ncbi:Bug family tripartite tricarboxylate transporter substrate binding protein [Rhodoplanes sp. Z2-YC6860]|uniref:Bug family tripartite tricarboxylate transporter substrate binding protein n=1 Tax=Rhodoplanes sp. Z2-YC6860 TaxID=674703 RepID=UPI00078DCAD3|nr:tripartite tricarboxylate transporter substrate binding protein [Rhodoplanes sp. Z2-YC6860]AMN43187.1 ABC transporter substrate-binding protein [Rhodoplanes sp. Z2-YC6860]
MITLRSITLAAVALLLSCAAALSQASQNWPNRPVTMLVPLPAGGIADLMARGCAQALSDEFGQPFVVENHPGASGNLAAAAVVKAPPDGSVLLFATQAQAAFNKMMFANLSYDPARDLVPIVLVLKSPVVFVGALDAPVTNFQAMLDYARANPGKLTSGQTGVGSMSHVAFEMLQQKTGIVLNGVPYKGGAPMVTDLLGGHLPMGSDLLSNFVHLAKDRKVRLLAVATARRFGDLPDVPTVQEEIRMPFEAAAWFTIMARTGTPADVVQKVNAAVNRYLVSAKAKQLIAGAAAEAGGGSPGEAAAFVKSEIERWAPVIKAAQISLN